MSLINIFFLQKTYFRILFAKKTKGLKLIFLQNPFDSARNHYKNIARESLRLYAFYFLVIEA